MLLSTSLALCSDKCYTKSQNDPAYQRTSVCVLLQFNHIFPTGGVAGAFVIVLNGIGKYIGLSFSVFLRVLLGSDNNCFRTMHAVNTIHHFVKSSHLLYRLCIRIKQILLDRRVFRYSYHYHTGFLVY